MHNWHYSFNLRSNCVSIYVQLSVKHDFPSLGGREGIKKHCCGMHDRCMLGICHVDHQFREFYPLSLSSTRNLWAYEVTVLCVSCISAFEWVDRFSWHRLLKLCHQNPPQCRSLQYPTIKANNSMGVLANSRRQCKIYAFYSGRNERRTYARIGWWPL